MDALEELDATDFADDEDEVRERFPVSPRASLLVVAVSSYEELWVCNDNRFVCLTSSSAIHV